MDNKLTGEFLLSTAGLTAAIGVAGTQIAYAIVLGGFYVGNITGANSPGPMEVGLHWLVIAIVIIQTVFGLYFLLQPDKK